MTASPIIKEKAPLILETIKKAENILLCCHPSPDPDSVGSSLAMKFALEQLGKKATVIKGDSDIPEAFAHFPGAGSIVPKNFFEVNLNEYDLFIAIDSAQLGMVSRRGEVRFPPNLKVVAIDHHETNGMFGNINLVLPEYPSSTQVLFDLFSEWGIKLNAEIASNLFVGLYTDTGSLKFPGMKDDTYDVAAKLVSHIPSVSRLIADMEYSNTESYLSFEANALRSIEVVSGILAISSVPLSFIRENNIPVSEIKTGEISSYLLTVKDWEITVSLVELSEGLIKASFRSKDADKFDVSKLTAALGGGGHKAAAGLILKSSLEGAKRSIVEKAKEMYNI